MQGDLRNFEDVDKALGTDKSVLHVFPHFAAASDSVFRKCMWCEEDDAGLLRWACRFDAVIHFAGRKAVGESVQSPMLYYTHNVVGAVNLIEACRKHNLKNVWLCYFPIALLHRYMLSGNMLPIGRGTHLA